MASKTADPSDFDALFERVNALLEEAAAVRDRIAATLRRSHRANLWPERRRIAGSQIPERRGRPDLGRMSKSWLAAQEKLPDGKA